MKQINEKVGHQNKCLTFAKSIIYNVQKMGKKNKNEVSNAGVTLIMTSTKRQPPRPRKKCQG
jgi:hypothetical protein